MSTSSEVETIVALPVPEEPATETAPVPAAEPIARQRKPRPAWVLPAAIAAIGVLISGTLGYVLYTTAQQRDAQHAQLVATKASLVSTQAQLTAAQQDAAQKKVTADYVALYVSDNGRVQTDYQGTILCTSYTECRTSAQQLLTDLQKFQSDRKAANVPFALENQDNDLGDAISAAIAGIQEVIGGMDTDTSSKVDDGYSKVNGAMLNIAKAETAMGTVLK